MNKNRIREKIYQCKEKGELALIPFLPAGYPDKDSFWEEMAGLDQNGADIIEIGVPFSDPMADGPVVEEASQKCLSQGVDLSWLLQELARRRREFQAEIVLMGYINPFLQFGLDNFVDQASRAGVSGVIIPDLPFEEGGELRSKLHNHNLDLIPLIGLNTFDSRIKEYAENDPCFIYFVSVMGTTGTQNSLATELREKLQKARELISSPLALGFGIKHPDQLESIRDYVDAVVFGSALIKHLGSGGSARDFMKIWTG